MNTIMPASAEFDAYVDHVGIIGHVAHDVQAGCDLVARQLAMPWQQNGSPLLLFVAIASCALLIAPGRLWLLRRLSRFLTRFHESPELEIHGNALGTVIISAATFMTGGLVLLTALIASVRMLPETGELVDVLYAGFVVVGVGSGIGRALYSPDDKRLRPMQLPPGLGKAIGTFSLLASLMLATAAFIDQASRILHASSVSWTLAQGALTVAEVVLIASFLMQAGRSRERLAGSAENRDIGEPAMLGWTAIGWSVLAVGCFGLLLGNVRFAALVLQELLWLTLLVPIAWVVTRFLDAGMARCFAGERRVARFASGIVGVDRRRIAQVAIVISALSNAIIWLITLALALAPLQDSERSIIEQIRPGPLWHSLRLLHLDLSGGVLLWACGVGLGGFFLLRTIRGWLEQRFLPATSLDASARSSIVTGLGYAGVILILLTVTHLLGVQIDRLTMVVSALSVGIGFGLQAVIQNFVSGLILLVERPVKLGDWVTVSGTEGRVRAMRVRATELQADDGEIAIVPNSAFISSMIVNKGDALGRSRFDLTVRVVGASCATAAQDELLALVGECEAIRRNPRPRAYLISLGEDAWSFRLRLHAVASRSQSGASSDLLLHLSRSLDSHIGFEVV